MKYEWNGSGRFVVVVYLLESVVLEDSWGREASAVWIAASVFLSISSFLSVCVVFGFVACGVWLDLRPGISRFQNRLKFSRPEDGWSIFRVTASSMILQSKRKNLLLNYFLSFMERRIRMRCTEQFSFFFFIKSRMSELSFDTTRRHFEYKNKFLLEVSTQFCLRKKQNVDEIDLRAHGIFHNQQVTYSNAVFKWERNENRKES